MNKCDLVDRLVAEMGLSPQKMIAYWESKKAKSLIPKKRRSVKKAKIPGQAPESEEPIEIPANDKIFLRMKEILREHNDVPEEDITPQANILIDFGLDSLDFVELVMQYEREFGISIPDNVSEKFVKVYDAWKYISTYAK